MVSYEDTTSKADKKNSRKEQSYNKQNGIYVILIILLLINSRIYLREDASIFCE
jgi:hypothetical protein